MHGDVAGTARVVDSRRDVRQLGLIVLRRTEDNARSTTLPRAHGSRAVIIGSAPLTATPFLGSQKLMSVHLGSSNDVRGL